MRSNASRRKPAASARHFLAILFATLTTACSSTWIDEPEDDPRGEVDDVLASWEKAIDEGRNGSVERARLESLIVKYPNDVRLLVAAATIAFDAGDRFRAVRYADSALQHDPASVPASVLRARFAMETGNLAFAERFLKTQIKRVPDAYQLHESEAALYYIDEKFDLSTSALKRAQALGAPMWRVAFHEGLIAEARGDLAAAKQAYRRVLQEMPDHPRATSRLRGLSIRAPK